MSAYLKPLRQFIMSPLCLSGVFQFVPTQQLEQIKINKREPNEKKSTAVAAVHLHLGQSSRLPLRLFHRRLGQSNGFSDIKLMLASSTRVGKCVEINGQGSFQQVWWVSNGLS